MHLSKALPKKLRSHHFLAFLILAASLLCLSMAAASPAATPDKASPDQPLPQDTGAAGLRLTLKRLSTTARLMHSTAHPDDEDGGMLTVESRGRGTHALLMTLTRGEGGQNKVGSSLLDSLGVLRTLELLAADRYYGVEQRFSRVADFGFSKNPEETLEKWQGHDVALDDMVRVIRTFHPDVLVARFTGTSRDGHGNHQASAIVTKEAFRAAGDPKRFPEQIQEGLLPWQAKKLYMGKLCWDSSAECEKDYTVKINSGKVDADLKESYIQFAMDGLRHQLSQGAAQWTVDPGDRFSYYKLVDSVIPNAADASGHESSFFEGIDTTLPGLANRIGEEQSKAPFLAHELKEVEEQIQQARAAAEKDSESAADPLFRALKRLDEIQQRVSDAVLSTAAKAALLLPLREKREECSHAINLALDISLEASTAFPQVTPGWTLPIKGKIRNGSRHALKLHNYYVDAPSGWKFDAYGGVIVSGELPVLDVSAGSDRPFDVSTTPPATVDYSKPYWHRDDPAVEGVNTIDDPYNATLPFPPAKVNVVASYSLGKVHNTISTPVLASFKDDQGTSRVWPVPVSPRFSVAVEPATQLARIDGEHAFLVKVRVESKSGGNGVLRLQAPGQSRVEPAQVNVHFDANKDPQEFDFNVLSKVHEESRGSIRAVLTSESLDYSDGYTLISREDLGAYYYFQPATQKLSFVNVNVPPNLTVGYIMGAGDEIPTALQQLGIPVELIPATALSKADLSKFSTIVLGIRVYDTQKDVIANNKVLLDYVSNGGTLIVQYNSGVGDFNAAKLAPFPLQLSRARVSVEEAPVQILASEDGAFHYPNEITQKDFDGWVQERGLYFAESWDAKFKPLLACNDPGEALQKGGLLRAQYGKGVYIYTGYAFFRQLPAGVSGAVRLYVNLLSAGHEPKTAQAQ